MTTQSNTDTDIDTETAMQDKALAQSECPLCRAANGCSLLQGKAIEDCWCRAETFPAPQSVSIAPIGVDACICRDCLKKLQQEASLNCTRLD